MRRLIEALALVAVLTAPSYAADAPDGPVVLTVAGAVSESNRGSLDPFHDAFLNFQRREFDAAMEFDRAMLAALPQVEVQAFHPRWPGVITATGPLITDVLNAVGANEGAGVAVMAMDGYIVELTAEQLAANTWIIAHSANGKPLGIGHRGPLWTLYDTGGSPATDEQEAEWVWSVLFIEVK